MVQTPPRIERSANPAELQQIEQARRALRRSARWASAGAIYLPAVLGVVMVGFTLASYPGDWAEKLLVSLAQLAGLLGALTLPMLLSSTGRTVFAYRRLQRDAQQAYPIAETTGEVTWGGRDRAIVATADGERLLSPFFTMFSAVPAYWHHFDALTPGAYSFMLLRESRLVLRAQPISDHAPPQELSAPERALRAAFSNGDAEVAANRAGRASAAQRRRLLVSRWWVFLGAPLLVALSYQSLRETWLAPATGVLVGCLVVLGITTFVLLLLGRVLRDALEGRVDSASGTVYVRFGKTDATGSIGANEFTLGKTQARALERRRPYRVYWFRHSRVVAGVGSADITRP